MIFPPPPYPTPCRRSVRGMLRQESKPLRKDFVGLGTRVYLHKGLMYLASTTMIFVIGGCISSHRSSKHTLLGHLFMLTCGGAAGSTQA